MCVLVCLFVCLLKAVACTSFKGINLAFSRKSGLFFSVLSNLGVNFCANPRLGSSLGCILTQGEILLYYGVVRKCSVMTASSIIFKCPPSCSGQFHTQKNTSTYASQSYAKLDKVMFFAEREKKM